MISDKYGLLVLNENDLCDLYMRDPERVLKQVLVDSDIKLDGLELENKPQLQTYIDPEVSVKEFDEVCQNTWFMPPEYMEMDIAKFVLDQCKEQAELQRAGEELLMFQERDMFPLLRYLKYLVDTMRKHNVVWGVGRGSSVSSYVLYLIGIHRINSLHYDLSIDEFLK